MSGYRIETKENCKIVWGSFPINDMSGILKMMGKKAVMDTSLADRIGATMVIGMPDDIKKLGMRTDLPISESRLSDARIVKTKSILGSLQEWLINGERGASSNALCKVFFGVPERAGNNHPLDPSDLRRCLLFIRSAGISTHLDKMATASKEWANLIEHWEIIHSTFISETKDPDTLSFDSAPKTYELMKKVLAL